RLRLYPGGGSATAGSSGASAGSSKPPPRPAPRPSAPPPSSPFAWHWPVDGALLSRFVPGEPTRQGIDIAGREGAPVRAAADGVVVYSGSGLVGYGELVIVKHDEHWLSAYGHNRARLVKEGDAVKSGQQIAELGSSGAVREMRQFELRCDGKRVDPLHYLPKRWGGSGPWPRSPERRAPRAEKRKPPRLSAPRQPAPCRCALRRHWSSP